MWSAGAILYELLSGKPAFQEKTREQTIEMINKENFKMEGDKWDTISVQAKDLVRKLMRFDQHKRINAADALEHIWLKEKIEFYRKDASITEKILKKCLVNMTLYKVNYSPYTPLDSCCLERT